MVHVPARGALLLLGILAVPATGVLAVRHAVGPEAKPPGTLANARIWVTGLAVDPMKEALDLTVQAVVLVPEQGAEVALASPTGEPLRVALRSLRGGRIALAGAGAVPAGRYAALRVGIASATQTLPVALALETGRELDLVVGVRAGKSGPTASIASLEQR
jgi:hypothetical protein